MKLHLLPTITLLPAPHDTAADEQIIEDWSRGLDWVKWLLGSVRARVEVLLVEDVSEWNEVAENLLRETVGPALKSAWQSAHANDLAGLMAAAAKLSAQLPPEAKQRSLQAAGCEVQGTASIGCRRIQVCSSCHQRCYCRCCCLGILIVRCNM